MSTMGNNPEPPRVAADRLRDQDASVRREVLAELARLGSDEAVTVLVGALRDPHPGVQEAAMCGLVRIGDERVVRRLVGLLREPTALRNMAVEVISQVFPAGSQYLIETLRSPDPDVRKLTLDAMGSHEAPWLVPLLLPLLSDPNRNVRMAAAAKLGRLRAREAAFALISLLEDDQWVAFSAINALAEIGDTVALDPLLAVIAHGDPVLTYAALEAVSATDQAGVTLETLTALADDVGEDLQPVLVKTLMALAERTGTNVWTRLDRSRWVDRLIRLLRASDIDARIAAMTALGILGEPSAASPILDMYAGLDQPTDEMTDRAIQALASIGNVPALEVAAEAENDRAARAAVRSLGVMRAGESVETLGRVRRTSTDWERRRLTVIALGLIGGPRAVELLIDAVDDETGYVRREAARLLGDTPDDSVVLVLTTRLQRERYQEVRNEIVDSLVRIGTPHVMGELLQLLHHPKAEVREAAATSLGKAKWGDGFSALREAANDPEARVRRAVVESLARYFDVCAIAPMIQALSDSDEKVRLAAVIGIGRWQTDDAHRALLAQGLVDPDVWVRYRAAELLGAHRVESAVPALGALVRSPREPGLVKRAAMLALGTIGGKEAYSVLTESLRVEDRELRDTAVAALEKATDGPAARREGASEWN